MRCKIIEIGPESAFFGVKEFLGKHGRFERADGAPKGWLAGRFYFDDPDPQDVYIFQMKVQPLQLWK